jgi:hypothetical protein
MANRETHIKGDDPAAIRICLACALPECRHGKKECELVASGLIKLSVITEAQREAARKRAAAAYLRHKERAAKRGAVPCPAS